MPPSFLRNAVIWSSGLFLLALSISSIVLALTGDSIWKSKIHPGSGIGLFNQEGCASGPNSCILNLRPDHFEDSTLPFITAVGFLSIFALVFAIYSVFGSVLDPGLYSNSIIADLLVAFIGIVLPLVVFVYSMAVYYKSDRQWVYRDPGSSDGTFTVESWSCSMKNALSDGPNPDIARDFSSVCNLSMAARWLTIPLFVFATMFFALVIITQLRKRKSHGSEEYPMQEQKQTKENSSASDGHL